MFSGNNQNLDYFWIFFSSPAAVEVLPLPPVFTSCWSFFFLALRNMLGMEPIAGMHAMIQAGGGCCSCWTDCC